MSNELEEISKTLNGKEVLITNTFVEGSLGYNIACIIRQAARRTWCVDNRYKMKDNINGYRFIENGRVVLLKGDLLTERTRIYDIIEIFNGRIDFEIDIKQQS